MDKIVTGHSAEMRALREQEAAMTVDEMVASVRRTAAELTARVGDVNLFGETITAADLANSLDMLAGVASMYAEKIRKAAA